MSNEDKRWVHEEILTYKKDEDEEFTWGDIKKAIAESIVEVLDDDEIELHNDSHYNHTRCYYMKVTRHRLETDAEQQARLKSDAMYNDRKKRERFDEFLKLKQEFEPHKIGTNDYNRTETAD